MFKAGLQKENNGFTKIVGFTLKERLKGTYIYISSYGTGGTLGLGSSLFSSLL